MKSPAVSVIMPAYNAEAFLDESIASVLGQSFDDLELLIVDDCSTDQTQEIVQKWAERDPRVRYTRLEINSGNPARPRNIAMQQASGQYIAFLDSDDYWLETKLEEQIAFMQDRDSKFSFTSYRRISIDGQQIGFAHKAPNKIDLHEYLGNTCIGTSTTMIDRSRLGDFTFNESCKVHEDFELWTRLLEKTSADFLNKDLTRYRRGHSSLSSNIARVAFAQAANYWNLSNRIGIIPAAMGFVSYATNAAKKRLAF